jgi:micrococcal nuclease
VALPILLQSCIGVRMNTKKIYLSLFFILSITLISCSIFKYDISIIISKQKDQPSIRETPTYQLPIYENFACIPSHEKPEIGLVTQVIDGDSIKAKINGKEFEIRYIGMNTPEYDSSERVAAEKATQENKKLVEGKKIFLFKDTSNTDKFQRLLRYVFTEEYFVNYELVVRGFAESKSYPPDIACQNLFIEAEKQT